MKKLYSLWSMALMAVMMMSLASCDWLEDEDIAYTLEGTWEGNMYVSSEWDGRTYDATYTEICFQRDPFKYRTGYGYWVDHYSNAGWGRNYVANHIEWRVRDRSIQIDFVEEGTTIWIENYGLDFDYFSGTIYDGDSRVRFSLRHTSSPNWDDYYYGWNDYYYYSKSADMTRASDSNSDFVAPKRIFRTGEGSVE